MKSRRVSMVGGRRVVPPASALSQPVCAGRGEFAVHYLYVRCSQTPGSAAAAGACAFGIPGTVAAGTYELRLFADDGYTRLATSNGLTVN